MYNPFLYSNDNKRYHTYSYFLKQKFGEKVGRVSLNAGFTCPNIDGTKGFGGCIYCSDRGSGEFAGDPTQSILHQLDCGIQEASAKWRTDKFIAYFQAHTNTYAPVEVLRELCENALSYPGVVGLSIATRPDCLPDEICTFLGELSRRTFLTVELGLQTIHDQTGRKINRCHSWEEFLQGFYKLRSCGISIGVHLINGLPGETPEMMLESADRVAAIRPELVKLHLLHVLENTHLAEMWKSGGLQLLSKVDYVNIVCDQLELFSPECVIGRLTGDGDARSLLGPTWSRRKREVLNAIDYELVCRNSWQGKYTTKPTVDHN